MRWGVKVKCPHLVIYSHIYFYSFILFIYLFIYSFILWLLFFPLRESNRRNYFTWHIWGQFQSTFALHSFEWGSVSCYREVRKKWFPSERRVSHLWGTRHTAVQHPACARGSILASRAPISALKDNIRNHHSLAKYAKENWNVPRDLKNETGYITIMYINELKRCIAQRKTRLNGSILYRHCLNNSFYHSEPYDKSK